MNISQIISSMTVEEKVGQLFMLAFAKNNLNEAGTLIKDHFVSGAYISNDNVPTIQDAAKLSQQLQALAHETRLQLPLLLSPSSSSSSTAIILLTNPPLSSTITIPAATSHPFKSQLKYALNLDCATHAMACEAHATIRNPRTLVARAVTALEEAARVDSLLMGKPTLMSDWFKMDVLGGRCASCCCCEGGLIRRLLR